MKKYKFLIFELYEESIVKYANKRAKSVEKSLLFIINNKKMANLRKFIDLYIILC